MYTVVMEKHNRKLTIKKSKRKTVSLQCMPDGELVVRAPLSMGKREILDFVDRKREWIERSMKRLSEHEEQDRALTLADGSRFMFLGKEFSVNRYAGRQAKVSVDYDKRHLAIAATDEPSARKAVLDFVRQSARTYLPIRTRDVAGRMQLEYKELRIKDQKSRWGSCSSKGNLNLNARVMLAPPEVIDYLIIHELAHLVHMNHSRQFYQLVEHYCPGYRRHQRWLKDHGYLLRWGRN